MSDRVAWLAACEDIAVDYRGCQEQLSVFSLQSAHHAPRQPYHSKRDSNNFRIPSVIPDDRVRFRPCYAKLLEKFTSIFQNLLIVRTLRSTLLWNRVVFSLESWHSSILWASLAACLSTAEGVRVLPRLHAIPRESIESR